MKNPPPVFPAELFAKADPGDDRLFYATPRLVSHIDDRAIGVVTGLYRDHFPDGAVLLDLMSSWVSHLPPERRYPEVVGHGMNAEELAANPRLSRWFVQDLNREQRLPLPDAAFDGAALCVSVQYLQRPVEVLAETSRVLRPDAPLVVTFSNRCFPTKVTAVWMNLAPADQARLVELFMRSAGFAEVSGRQVLGPPGDPLWTVVGRTAA